MADEGKILFRTTDLYAMKSIVEYTIIEDLSVNRVIAQVNAKLREGWVPQGGLAYSSREGDPRVLQAMVLYGKETTG